MTSSRGASQDPSLAAGIKVRNPSLDVLRCIAILLVVGFHMDSVGYRLWSRAGWIGVDLFFVLSGFLVSGLLFTDYKTHGRIDWKRFLLRRGLKIWPSFYVFLGVTAVLYAVCRIPFPRKGFLLSAASC